LKNARNNELSDRRSAAAEAKAALLNAYRTAKDTAEPTRLAKQAERQAIAAAREERRAARERLKLEELERAKAAEPSVRPPPKPQHAPMPTRAKRLTKTGSPA
jgi:hypothetical protein